MKLHSFWKLPLLVVMVALTSPAQILSVLDGVTPAGVAPGVSSGSRALSSFEHYNAFSGGFAPVLPLYHVGGRGEVGVDLVWNFQPNWAAYKQFAGLSTSLSIDPYPSNNIASNPNPSAATNAIGFGAAGAVYARTAPTYTVCNGATTVGSTVTRIVYVSGSGAEVTLIDNATNGGVYNVPNACSSGGWSTADAGRGTAFHSTDNSMLQFISDSAVVETNPTGIFHGGATVSGSLHFTDGTTYRIDNSMVSWIRDRNGNTIAFDYTGGPSVSLNWYLHVPLPTTITDPLGRATTINYDDSYNNCNCLTIKYPGWDANHPPIQIVSDSLSNLLRSGDSPQTMDQLFPGTGQPTSYNYNPTLASYVQLPDGSKYTFQYNSYGELARVTLPTNGALEYDYGDGHNVSGNKQGDSGHGFEGNATDGSAVMIYRRLQERREYANSGSGSNGVTSKTGYTVSYLNGNTVETETTYEPSTGAAAGLTIHTMYGTPLDSIQTANNGCNAWNEGLEKQTDFGSTSSPARTVTYGYAAQSGCMNNPQLTTVTTILNDTNQQSKVVYGYDQYNNISDVKEYDWGNGTPGNLIRHTTSFYETDQKFVTPSVNMIRLFFYSVVYDASGNKIANWDQWYDEYGPNGPQDYPGITIPGHDGSYGAGFTVRGNVTSKRQWRNTDGAFLTTRYGYDIAGNIVSTLDPDGNTNSNGDTSTFSYSDPQNTFAHVTKTTNAKGQTTSATYDYITGKVTQTNDLNSVATTYDYSDPLYRITKIRRAAGGGPALESQTNYGYPNTQQVDVWQDQKSTQDYGIHTETITDGFGRTADNVKYDSTSQVEVHTAYNALGLVSSVSNPARPGDTLVYTATTYDTLGRVLTVTTPDNAVTNYSYATNTSTPGRETTVTDPSGRNKIFRYDALNRLISVYEDTGTNKLNYGINYGYDVLDNLIWVSQGNCPSCQGRTFAYNSLSQLTAAANPESGAVNYPAYDANGNLKTRTDARGVTTSYVYDKLNRLSTISYAGGTNVASTPSVTYTYDDTNVAYSKGHLTSVSNSNATTSYTAFDALGRVTASRQVVGGQTYNFVSYTYNLADALTGETYPSGRALAIGYDPANQTNAVSGTLGGAQTNYVSGLTYKAQGAPDTYTYGGLYRSLGYNSRLQVTSIIDALASNHGAQLLNLAPDWGGTNNNGTLQGITQNNGGPGYPQFLTFKDSFTYDGVNRLQTVTGKDGSNNVLWSQSYDYL